MFKQAADTNVASPGAVINTMISPAAGRIGDRYTPSWFAPTGGASADRALFQVLALAGTYGTMTAVARYIGARLQKDVYENKFKKKVKSYLNAEMPIFSPDPIVGRDPVNEDALEGLGVPRTANSGISREYMNKTSNAWDEKYSLLMPTLAVLGSSALAYKIMDSLMEKRRLAGLDTEITKTKDQLDKLNYDYMMDARNPKNKGFVEKMSQDISKEALLGAAADAVTNAARGAANWAYDTGDPRENSQTILGGAAALAVLVAATSFGVGAIASKSYFDRNDVNRKRLKIMTEALRGVASTERPPVLIPVLDARTMKGLNRGTSTASKPVRKLTVAPETRQLSAAPFDPYDVTMQQAVNV